MKHSNILLSVLTGLLFLSGCTSYNHLHTSRIDVGYFKNKGEGNISGSLDLAQNSLGFNGNFMYAIGDNLALSTGISHYGTRYIPDPVVASEPFDVDEFSDLKGTSLRFALGYFSNSKERSSFYIEVFGGMEKAFNTHTINLNNASRKTYEYNPFTLYSNVAFGMNKEKIALGFAGKLSYNYLGANLPLERYSNGIVAREIIMFHPAFNLRAGKGNTKFNFQVGVEIIPFFDDFYYEPSPSISLGITHVIGREKTKEKPKSGKTLEL